jgi:hypothetical protein
MSTWTRNDLPPAPDELPGVATGYVQPIFDFISEYQDEVLAHLNAHHPKPDGDCSQPEVQEWVEVVRELRRERDEARREWAGWREQSARRVEQLRVAERERDESLRKKGEMVDRAVRAERERDAAVARAEAAERAVAETTKTVADVERRLGEIRALHADTVATQRRIEARTASAVSRADVEKALDTGIRGTTDGGLIDQDTSIPSGECVRLAVDAVCGLLGIDAEQAVDPIMSVIRDGLNVWGTTDEGVRQIAESVRRAISSDGSENAL